MNRAKDGCKQLVITTGSRAEPAGWRRYLMPAAGVDDRVAFVTPPGEDWQLPDIIREIRFHAPPELRSVSETGKA